MNRSAGSSLLSLIIFYFALIVLIILFAYQVLNNQRVDDLYITVLWVTALIVPVVLLVNITLNFLRLWRERKIQAPGAILKTRFILFFLILVVLSAGPQALLSLSFIRVIGDTWFNDKIGEGLDNSLDITVNVQRSLAENLKTFVYSPLFESISNQTADNTERFFVQMQQIRPSIVAVQTFTLEGNTIYFGGAPMARFDYSDLLLTQEGIVVRDIRQQRDFIRIQRTINNAIIVLVEELPSGFKEKTLQILEAAELFNEYQDTRDLLYTGILVFYGIFSLPLLLLAILAGFYLSDVLTQPIVHLENAIRKVAEGNFSFRILIRPQEELGHLVESFNLMVTELDRSRHQLVQSERIAAWKEIAQRLAHEIKNPLTPIQLSVDRLKRKHEQNSADFPAILDSTAEIITREVNHLVTLITEFRDFARLPFPQQQLVSLKQIILDALNMYKTYNIEVSTKDIDEDALVFIDPTQFRQVFGNLLQNAIAAIGKNAGTIQFYNQVLTVSGKKFQRIQIQDNGSGMSQSQLARIFDPYFTTKEQGTGLGLAIVQRIILDHNGRIWVESELGHGTRFFIDLPVLETR